MCCFWYKLSLKEELFVRIEKPISITFKKKNHRLGCFDIYLDNDAKKYCLRL